MAFVLRQKAGGDYVPHPEGIYPAVCLDVIDLGPVEQEYQGESRMVNKIKVVWETESLMEDGRPFTISKNFTASLHPKSNLAKFLGKWRGKPVADGEEIDLEKLIGACCTLVISHQETQSGGRTYAAIDAISKPSKKIKTAGFYDPVATRQRIAEYAAKQEQKQQPVSRQSNVPTNTTVTPAPAPSAWQHQQQKQAQEAPAQVPAPTPAPAPEEDDVPF